MGIADYSIEDWLDKIQLAEPDLRRMRTARLKLAVDALHEKGYKAHDILGSGAKGVVLKAEVIDPMQIRERYFKELHEKSSAEEGYNLVELLSRAIVAGEYCYNDETKGIVNDPAFGRSFADIQEARDHFRKYNESEIEKIVNQMAVRSFPRKGQMVAVKLSLGTEDRRFKKEKRIGHLNLLNEEGSENVVAYYEYGTLLEQFQYHATECVLNSFPFRQLPLQEQKLTALHLALRGVSFIHNYGNIVHRDLKPENIIVSIVPDKYYRDYVQASNEEKQLKYKIRILQSQIDDFEAYKNQNTVRYKHINSQIKEFNSRIDELQKLQENLPEYFRVSSAQVSDFGLAKFFSDEFKPGSSTSALTQEGAVIGTPFYMPPEQIGVGTDGKYYTDFRSDIYSMCCILYEIITTTKEHPTGIPPYLDKAKSSDFLSFMRIVSNEKNRPTLPRRLNKNADYLLSKICSKGLSREMHKRYSCVDDMITDLELWYDFQAKPARGKFWAKTKEFFGSKIIPGKDLSEYVFE